jgi:uncharacterized protein YggE
MEPKQASSGVKAFGSAVLRVAPDFVAIQFSVGRTAKQPRDAFRETHQVARAVRAYLGQVNVTDVAASRVTLAESYEYVGNKRERKGYFAQVSFNVLLSDLDRMEEVLVGVVDAGANQIGSVEFRTSKLKEYRAEARRRAVAAAREKAEIYCRAAGVELGPVLHIEDVSPNVLRGTGEGHTTTEPSGDDAEASRALAPDNIVVGAAVSITFALGG